MHLMFKRYDKARGLWQEATAHDHELCQRFKADAILDVEVKEARNPGHHRKFFSMVGFIFKNQDKYETVTDLLIEIKLRTGHYKEHVTARGKLVYIPKSISFAKMDQKEFEEFYDKAIDICIKYILPETWKGKSTESLKAIIDEVILYGS